MTQAVHDRCVDAAIERIQGLTLAGISSGNTNESDTFSVTATSSVPALVAVAVGYTSPKWTHPEDAQEN